MTNCARDKTQTMILDPMIHKLQTNGCMRSITLNGYLFLIKREESHFILDCFSHRLYSFTGRCLAFETESTSAVE